jgi:hypothetical protein
VAEIMDRLTAIDATLAAIPNLITRLDALEANQPQDPSASPRAAASQLLLQQQGLDSVAARLATVEAVIANVPSDVATFADKISDLETRQSRLPGSSSLSRDNRAPKVKSYSGINCPNYGDPHSFLRTVEAEIPTSTGRVESARAFLDGDMLQWHLRFVSEYHALNGHTASAGHPVPWDHYKDALLRELLWPQWIADAFDDLSRAHQTREESVKAYSDRFLALAAIVGGARAPAFPLASTDQLTRTMYAGLNKRAKDALNVYRSELTDIPAIVEKAALVLRAHSGPSSSEISRNAATLPTPARGSYRPGTPGSHAGYRHPGAHAHGVLAGAEDTDHSTMTYGLSGAEMAEEEARARAMAAMHTDAPDLSDWDDECDCDRCACRDDYRYGAR